MNIGFDIDDTLTNGYQHAKNVYKKHFKTSGKHYAPNKKKPNTIAEMYKWTKEEFDNVFYQIKQQLMHNHPVNKHAKKVLQTLKKQGHTIFIISRRFSKNAYERSQKWLKDNNLPYDKLIVNAGDKLQACKEHNIHFFVDDLVSVCDNLNKNGIKAYVLKTRFNQEKSTVSPRVNSLEEFMQAVLSHEEELQL